jgi:hypothetical protein
MATSKTEKQKQAEIRFIALGRLNIMSKQLKQLRRHAKDVEIQMRIDRALLSIGSLEHSVRDNDYESWKTSEK